MEAASGFFNEDDIMTAFVHVEICLMLLDVGVVSYGFCSAQSQSDADPL